MSIAPKRLHGKIAIVTASTDGIGLAIAQRLAQEGAKVIISSRKESNVEKATKLLCDQGLDVKGLVCHVSKADDRKKLFEEARKIGGLDILVSNAAINPEFGDVLACSESCWDKIFDINVKSSFLLVKESLPLLRQSKAGRVIFISSVVAFQPVKYLGAYAVTKTALLGLTKAASLQLATDNITVNCIAPGAVNTNFLSALISTKDLTNQALSYIPMKRFGQPHEISGAVAFLASDDGAYITGETIAVGGGALSRL